MRIVDGFDRNSDHLPPIVAGALPDQLALVDDMLIVTYASSDQVETFRIEPQEADPTAILVPIDRAFANQSQTAFPNALDRRALFDDGPYLMGEHDPDYFRGRMPQETVFAAAGRRLFVANRLGESITIFRLEDTGELAFDRLVDIGAAGTPPFPATLAEVGEDFYTSSRVGLDRDVSCQSCHPGGHKDSKVWHVAATPGRTMRMTLTNRNLRGTPPFYRTGIRRNLETFRGTFRSMAPEGPFGFFESPAPFDANGDGVLNDSDRGRTVADVNRNRMFVLERTGVSFEKTSAAIAAFLEAEPRLLPNPFRNPDGSLGTSVPVAYDEGGALVFGDAVNGEHVFQKAGCLEHHVGPTFTSNRVLSLDDNGTRDRDWDGIPDGVVRSFEQSIFDRVGIPFERYQKRLPRERLPFAGVDSDRRLNFANTPNSFTPADPSLSSRSPFSGRLLTNPAADTRNVNVASLRGVWDAAPFLHHGRAVNLLAVQGLFNDLGRHGDPIFLGTFDPADISAETNQRFRDLVAYLKSIQ